MKWYRPEKDSTRIRWRFLWVPERNPKDRLETRWLTRVMVHQQYRENRHNYDCTWCDTEWLGG